MSWLILDSAELQNIETANDKPFSQKGNTIFIKNLGMTKTLARKLCVPYGEVIDVTADKCKFKTFCKLEDDKKQILFSRYY